MASVNKVIIVGNLGADPEVRFLPSGEAVANLRIATTDKWKDKASGEQKENTEWHRVSFFGRLAEVCGEYLKKGSQIYVDGSLHTRKWQDKDGQDRYSTEIKGHAMQMLGSRGDRGETPAERAATSPATEQAGGGGGDYASAKGRPAAAKKPAGKFDDMEDDIPF